MLGTLTLLLLTGLLIALWVDALGAHELARAHSRRLCHDARVQLLDETVALQKLSFARVDGRLALRRRYAFEVSFDGSDRHPGSITFIGRRRHSYLLPMPVAEPHLHLQPFLTPPT